MTNINGTQNNNLFEELTDFTSKSDLLLSGNLKMIKFFYDLETKLKNLHLKYISYSTLQDLLENQMWDVIGYLEDIKVNNGYLWYGYNGGYLEPCYDIYEAINKDTLINSNFHIWWNKQKQSKKEPEYMLHLFMIAMKCEWKEECARLFNIIKDVIGNNSQFLSYLPLDYFRKVFPKMEKYHVGVVLKKTIHKDVIEFIIQSRKLDRYDLKHALAERIVATL